MRMTHTIAFSLFLAACGVTEPNGTTNQDLSGADPTEDSTTGDPSADPGTPDDDPGTPTCDPAQTNCVPTTCDPAHTGCVPTPPPPSDCPDPTAGCVPSTDPPPIDHPMDPSGATNEGPSPMWSVVSPRDPQ